MRISLKNQQARISESDIWKEGSYGFGTFGTVVVGSRDSMIAMGEGSMVRRKEGWDGVTFLYRRAKTRRSSSSAAVLKLRI